jgi:4-hydroxyphenylacetate 3-monooxygenase
LNVSQFPTPAGAVLSRFPGNSRSLPQSLQGESMPKSGADHLRSLDDGRCILIDGGRVASVTEHVAFRNAAHSVARLYDYQCVPENMELMTFEVPGTDRRVNRCWHLPKSREELVKRREALVAWSELHQGFMGRSPDHVASTLCAMLMGEEAYRRHRGARFDALREYFNYARDNDLYVSYVIIDPQGDRSKASGEGANAGVAVSIVDEDSEGVTVRGAKMLGTGAALSNELMVTTLRPLKPDETHYALTAVVPIALKGVKLLSRRSYEQAAPSVFDYPLASRYDENDALLYFDDCKIPWNRVFVHRDPAAQLARWHETPAHSYQNYQSAIRLMVKLRFLLGLARRIAETIGTTAFASVVQTLGELAADAAMIEAFVVGMEAKGSFYGPYFVPDRALLYAAQVQAQRLYPRMIATIRELAGGGLLMLPSSVADFENPEIACLIGRTQHGAIGTGMDRVKLMKLAWDALGSEFGSRHLQYEMFYSGPRTTTAGMAYRTCDWEHADHMLESFLAGYDSPALSAA